MKRRSSRVRPSGKGTPEIVEFVREALVELALAERQPGRLWLWDFVVSRRRGQPVREETLKRLEESFVKILAGQAPDLALDMKKPRGRPLDADKLREEILLEDLLLDLYKAGHTREQCIAMAHDDHGYPEWLVVDVWEKRLAATLLPKRRRNPPNK